MAGLCLRSGYGIPRPALHDHTVFAGPGPVHMRKSDRQACMPHAAILVTCRGVDPAFSQATMRQGRIFISRSDLAHAPSL